MDASHDKRSTQLHCRVCGASIAEKYHGHLKCTSWYKKRIELPNLDRRRERRRHAIAAGAEIRCPRCGLSKPAAEFYASGASSYCKPCQREYSRERLRSRRTNGGPWVYFIHCEALDAVKIGYSAESPQQRLRANQVGNPLELTLARVIEGDRKLEKRLHREFSQHHLRGEWFGSAHKILTTPVDQQLA